MPVLAMMMAPGPVTAGPIDVVVTAAPPIDSQRLADALRAYLDEYGIHVEIAVAAEPGDLRRQLADARRIGEEVRAMAVVRAQDGEGVRGTIEIDVVDLATEKVLIAEVPRPPRDEDLYRVLALKIQASLRATMSEAPERLGPRIGLTRLAQSRPGSGDESSPGAHQPLASLESGYVVLTFPLAGVALQGLSLATAFAPRPWLDLTLGIAVLGTLRAEGGGVVAVATVVPLFASARWRVGGRRAEALMGPAGGLAYVAIDPSSTTSMVHATHHLVPALGVELEGRFRVGASAWLYARGSALGVLLGERYRAEGQVILDTSRFQASLSAGVGIGLW